MRTVQYVKMIMMAMGIHPVKTVMTTTHQCTLMLQKCVMARIITVMAK